MRALRDMRSWLQPIDKLKSFRTQWNSDAPCQIPAAVSTFSGTEDAESAQSIGPVTGPWECDGECYHLYVVVHGFNSRPEHMTYLADQMRAKLGLNTIVHVAVCNRARIPDIIHNPTHDGVDAGGQRLAIEIREVVKHHEDRGSRLRYISILGNSMGGIYARYAIGMLYEIDTRTVCGLEPVSFITTASPHLGLHGFVSKMLERVVSNLVYGGLTAEQMFLADSADYKQNGPTEQVSRSISLSWREIPALLSRRRESFPPKPMLARDYRRLPTPRSPRREVIMESRNFGAAQHEDSRVIASAESSPCHGRQWQSEDDDSLPKQNDDSTPLLVAMTTDRPWPFLSALAAFRHRVLYGNTCNDPLVPYETATIASQPLHDWRVRPPISPSFPHIIDDSGCHVLPWPPGVGAESRAESTSGGDSRGQHVAAMRSNLERLGWRRVSARFLRSVRVGDRQAVLPGLLGAVGVDAHNCISVVRPLINGLGRDSVSHVCAVLDDHRRALQPDGAARQAAATHQGGAASQAGRAEERPTSSSAQWSGWRDSEAGQ